MYFSDGFLTNTLLLYGSQKSELQVDIRLYTIWNKHVTSWF